MAKSKKRSRSKKTRGRGERSGGRGERSDVAMDEADESVHSATSFDSFFAPSSPSRSDQDDSEWMPAHDPEDEDEDEAEDGRRRQRCERPQQEVELPDAARGAQFWKGRSAADVDAWGAYFPHDKVSSAWYLVGGQRTPVDPTAPDRAKNRGLYPPDFAAFQGHMHGGTKGMGIAWERNSHGLGLKDVGMVRGGDGPLAGSLIGEAQINEGLDAMRESLTAPGLDQGEMVEELQRTAFKAPSAFQKTEPVIFPKMARAAAGAGIGVFLWDVAQKSYPHDVDGWQSALAQDCLTWVDLAREFKLEEGLLLWEEDVRGGDGGDSRKKVTSFFQSGRSSGGCTWKWNAPTADWQTWAPGWGGGSRWRDEGGEGGGDGGGDGGDGGAAEARSLPADSDLLPQGVEDAAALMELVSRVARGEAAPSEGLFSYLLIYHVRSASLYSNAHHATGPTVKDAGKMPTTFAAAEKSAVYVREAIAKLEKKIRRGDVKERFEVRFHNLGGLRAAATEVLERAAAADSVEELPSKPWIDPACGRVAQFMEEVNLLLYTYARQIWRVKVHSRVPLTPQALLTPARVELALFELQLESLRCATDATDKTMLSRLGAFTELRLQTRLARVRALVFCCKPLERDLLLVERELRLLLAKEMELKASKGSLDARKKAAAAAKAAADAAAAAEAEERAASGGARADGEVGEGEGVGAPGAGAAGVGDAGEMGEMGEAGAGGADGQQAWPRSSPFRLWFAVCEALSYKTELEVLLQVLKVGTKGTRPELEEKLATALASRAADPTIQYVRGLMIDAIRPDEPELAEEAEGVGLWPEAEAYDLGEEASAG